MPSSRKKPARKKTAGRSEDLMVLHQLGQHVVYEDPEDEEVPENASDALASEATIKVPTDPHHLFLLEMYWSCKTKINDSDHKPGIRAVWAAIEFLQESGIKHHLVERVGEREIWWRGTNKSMSRKRVQNLLSDFHNLPADTIQEVLSQTT